MRILIVDADGEEVERARQAVETFGYRCRAATTASDAWQAIEQSDPDVVIIAPDLPDGDGVELCRRVRSRPARIPIYIVLLSPSDDREPLRAAMQAGIDDLVARPFDADELHLRLQVAERMTLQHGQIDALRTELDRVKTTLRASARTDALTGLGNRLQLTDDLDLFQGQLDRYGHRYAAAILDVDAFRGLTERYGQLAAEEALRVVAETVGQSLRTGDRAYRYGGDQFVVLLPQQTLDTGRIAVERIRTALDALAFPHEGNAPWDRLTLSVGLAVFADGQTGSYQSLLAWAESALQRAKATGRNQVVCDALGDVPPPA